MLQCADCGLFYFSGGNDDMLNSNICSYCGTRLGALSADDDDVVDDDSELNFDEE